MVLARYGNGGYYARFFFRWKRQIASVVFRYDNRADFARMLRMWRKARSLIYTNYTKECWNGIRVPMIEKRRLEIKRFSLRWLACRPCVLTIHNARDDAFKFKRYFYSVASYERTFCGLGEEFTALGF